MFADDNPKLFFGDQLCDVLDRQMSRIAPIVSGIPKDRFLNSSVDTVVEHVVGQIEMTPLEIYSDKMQMSHNETQFDVAHDFSRGGLRDGKPLMVPGVQVVVELPYTGDFGLFSCRPSRYTASPPRANARPAGADGVGKVEIIMIHPADAPADEFKQIVREQVAGIGSNIENQREQLDTFNSALPAAVRHEVDARRSRLEKQMGIPLAIGIPLERSEAAASFRPIVVEKRPPRPIPDAPSGGYEQEPGLSSEDYARVLDVIRHQGRSFESTPGTFSKLDEEELRNIVVAHLNIYFKGKATGETFRKHGKTDIRIEAADRSAFVGECKVWGGAKAIDNACDQLLRYQTWRDCKAALIVFNKAVSEFTTVLEALPKAIQEHKNCLREHHVAERGEWRFDLSSRDDPGREVQVHVFAFDLYAKKKA